MSELILRTVDELDALPNRAVVCDGNCDVYQKQHLGPLHHLELLNFGIASAWFLPGDPKPYPTTIIALPVHLLDDGL